MSGVILDQKDLDLLDRVSEELELWGQVWKNLLTDNQLDVKMPGEYKSLRHRDIDRLVYDLSRLRVGRG